MDEEHFNSSWFVCKPLCRDGLSWALVTQLKDMGGDQREGFLITVHLWVVGCPVVHPKGGTVLPADLLGQISHVCLPRQSGFVNTACFIGIAEEMIAPADTRGQ